MFFTKKRKLRKLLHTLIEKATVFGLPEKDVIYAKDFWEHNEPALCLDQIATQLHEFHIAIDSEFYETVVTCLLLLQLPPTTYSFLEELFPANSKS